MLTLQIVCYFGGITSLAYEDARHLSVPALLCDGWLLMMVLFAAWLNPGRLIPASGVAIVLTAFALLTRGLGSADIIVLTAAATVFNTGGLLLTLLCASLSCLCWSLHRGARRAAFIPHLLIGSVTAEALLQLAPGLRALLS